MANCLYKYLHDSYTTKIDLINHAFAKLVVAWLYMGLDVTKSVFRVIDTQTSLLTGPQIYGGRGSLSHDFVFFLSLPVRSYMSITPGSANLEILIK